MPSDNLTPVPFHTIPKHHPGMLGLQNTHASNIQKSQCRYPIGIGMITEDRVVFDTIGCTKYVLQMTKEGMGGDVTGREVGPGWEELPIALLGAFMYC